MKHLKLFFACMLMAVLSIGQVWGVTITGAAYQGKGGNSGSGGNATATVDGVTITSTKAYYASDTEIREYQNGTVTISSSSTITNITITCTAANRANFSTTTGTLSAKGTSPQTWTGSATSITFTADAQSRWSSIEVTLSGGSSTPTLSATPTTIDFGTVDQNAVVASKTVAVSFENLTGSVTYSGLSSPFTATGAISTTGDNITIAANTSNVGTYSQTLTIQSAADSKSQDVTVKMRVITPLAPIAGGIVDELSISDLGVSSTSYTAFTDKQASNTGHSDAVYAGTVARNGNATKYNIQLNSGQTSSKLREIATSTSGGYVRRVQAIWATQTANTAGRKLTVYGSESAYNGSEAASSGTSLGDLTYAAGDPYAYIDIAGDYPYIQIVANGAIYMDQINVTWVANTATVAKPVISGAESFLTSTAVSITCDTEGATVYYTTDGTDPKTSESKQSGTSFTLYNSATVRAIANKGSDWSAEATSKTFTKITPITVAAAIAAIPNTDDVVNDQYVEGIVCTEGTSVNASGQMTYYISDDGSETSRLQIYLGKNLNNTAFSAVSDLAIGDRVVVFGQLKNYKGTKEMNSGNYLVSKQEPAVATPVFTPNGGGFMGETDVTITCATEGSAIYYTLNGTTPTKSSTPYTAAIHLNATTTITAIAYVGEESSLVVAKEFTLTAPMTVAAAFDELSTTDPLNNAAVSGIVFQVDACAGNTYATYWISDDGSDSEKKLEIYHGYGLNGANFAAGGIQEGDEVTVFGNLTIYKQSEVEVCREFSAGSRLLAFNRPVVAVSNVALDQHTASIEVGETVTLTATVSPDNATDKSITWSVQSGSDKASVVDGVVSGLVAGEAVIRAASTADPTKYDECTVTVTAADPTKHVVTFAATVDKTSENADLTLTKGDVTIAITAGDGRFNNNTDYRIYKNAVFTVSGANSFITKIEFTCTGSNPITGFEDVTGLDTENDKWTGNTNSVSFTASNKQVQITQLIVTYKDDTRAASGLEWSTDEVEITLGDGFTPANLVNPNSIDASAITIASDNTDLAVVNDGVVSLVADAMGTAHITATFAGDATYKPASVSYTIIVNDPTPKISVSKLNVNFGSVTVGDAVPDAQTITVTLANVASVTATLGGDNADAFSISPASLTESGDITISLLANTDAAASYAATITISDGEEGATDKTVNLSFAVIEQDNVGGTWTLASSVAAGDKIIIAQHVEADGTVLTMGKQNANNRAQVESSVAGTQLTPAEGTNVFTLVDAGDGKFAIKASNDNYLSAAGSGTSNYLKEAENYDSDKEKWAITFEGTGAKIQASSNNRNTIRYNGSSHIFSCYAESGQEAVDIYTWSQTPGTVTATDMAIVAGESKAIAYTTNNTEDPGVTYTVVSGGEYIGLFKGVITGVKPGTATVRVSIAATDNYTAASKEITITVTNPTAPAKAIEAVGGKFIIDAKGDTAVFSRGNLRYNVATEQWYCAEHQYDFVGEGGNLHFGDANYTGEFDLFGWSCESSNYGLLQSNHDDVYTGDFVDWGGLFASDAKTWSTFNTDQMNYVKGHQQWTTLTLDPTPEDEENGDEIRGLVLFPYDWTAMPAGYEHITYGLYDWWDEAGFRNNTIDPSAWSAFESAGAVFLPMAGARAGHWGNTWDGTQESTRKNPNPNGGNSYCFVDNIGWYGYYWLSTPDSRTTHQHCANYLIFLGWGEGPTTADDDDVYYPPVVWSREKRRGNSVRLVNIIPRQYTVTYTAGEGTGVVPTDANKYLDGAAITLADASGLSKDGYRFAGWKFKGVTYNDTYTVNNVLRDEAIIFEAQWEELDWQTVRSGLTEGNYYTICYDKEMQAIRGASLWSFSNRDANFAYLVSEDAPYEAGKPYIVYAESDKLEAVVVGDATLTAGSNGALHGTFADMDQAALNTAATTAGADVYMVVGTELRRATGYALDGITPLTGNSLPAQRAYVIVDEIPTTTYTPAPGKKYRSMALPRQTPTGFENAEASDKPMKVLINGQLYILRGEKMYNVNGQVVK